MRDWILKKDMNFDGAFTITDVWLFIKSLYFYPGDYIVKGLIDTKIGNFFEFSIQDYGGVMSGLVSFLAWVFLCCLPFGLIESARESEFYTEFKKGLNGPSKK